MKKLLFLLMLTLFPTESKNLGTFGETFEILESDLLEQMLLKKLQSN